MRSGTGYHVLQVVEAQPDAAPAFDEALDHFEGVEPVRIERVIGDGNDLLELGAAANVGRGMTPEDRQG